MDSNNNNTDSNNNDNVTEALNNHSNNSICLLVKTEFFHLMFESVQIIQIFIMGSGKFLHIEGPMYDKVFCPMLVFRKENLSLGKLFVVSILQCKANSKTSFQKKGDFCKGIKFSKQDGRWIVSFTKKFDYQDYCRKTKL